MEYGVESEKKVWKVLRKKCCQCGKLESGLSVGHSVGLFLSNKRKKIVFS